MRSTGIVRHIDNLGRVVVPAEIRETMFITPDSPLMFFVEGSRIIIEKYQPGCYICGYGERLKAFHDKKICMTCVKKAAELLK